MRAANREAQEEERAELQGQTAPMTMLSGRVWTTPPPHLLPSEAMLSQKASTDVQVWIEAAKLELGRERGRRISSASRFFFLFQEEEAETKKKKNSEKDALLPSVTRL